MRQNVLAKRTTEHTIPAVEQVSSDNKAKESKPSVLIAGDSIIKDINGGIEAIYPYSWRFNYQGHKWISVIQVG